MTVFFFRSFDSSLLANVSKSYYYSPDGLFEPIEEMTQKDSHTLTRLRYYNPNSNGSWAHNLALSGDNLEVTYGNYYSSHVGVASFKRVSSDTSGPATCPGLTGPSPKPK